MTVGDRGQISPEILTAYAESQDPAQQPIAQPAPTAPTAPSASVAEAGSRRRVVVRPVPGATGITRTICTSR